MDTNEQILQARGARLRRSRSGVLVDAAVILAAVLLLSLLPKRSPLVGVAMLGMAAARAATRLYVEGRDDWQQRRALLAFAFGSSCGVLWLVGDAFRVAFTDASPANPGRTLTALATGWLVAALVLGLRGSPPDEDG